MKAYWVYILASNTGTLYVGVTSNLQKRIWEHKSKLIAGFTAKYNINNLVYFKEFNNVVQAIEAEKRIKGWNRAKKLELVKSINPRVQDLYEPADPSATLQDDTR